MPTEKLIGFVLHLIKPLFLFFIIVAKLYVHLSYCSLNKIN